MGTKNFVCGFFEVQTAYFDEKILGSSFIEKKENPKASKAIFQVFLGVEWKCFRIFRPSMLVKELLIWRLGTPKLIANIARFLLCSPLEFTLSANPNVNPKSNLVNIS